jgi:ribosomal RNA-processing protein 12
MRYFRLNVAEVQQNINHLASFAGNFLSILFNVFSQTVPSFRSPISDCIRAFLNIATPDDLRTAFAKVSSLLTENLNASAKSEKGDLPSLSQTAIDLTNVMVPYLPADTIEPLWNLIVPLVERKTDPNLQRRAYRCLANLASSESGKEFLLRRLQQVEQISRSANVHAISQKVKCHHSYSNVRTEFWPCTT